MIALKKSLIVISIMLFGVTCFSQVAKDKVNSSPYHVVYNHLYYLQSDHYDPTKAARSFNISGSKKAKNAAIQLKQIMDGRGAIINLEYLPKIGSYKDSVTGLPTFFMDINLPDIYVEKVNGKWFYSAYTVSSIPALFKETFPLGQNFEIYFESPSWKKKLFGLQYWQWICLFGLLVSFFIIFLIIRVFSSLLIFILSRSKRLKKFLDKNKNVNRGKRILSLWVSAKFVSYFVPSVELSPLANTIIIKGLGILAIFFVILLVLRVIDILFDYFSKIAEKNDSSMDDHLLPIIKKIVNALVWIVGVIYVLSNLNINVTAILAGLSIGGLALALAAQDTVKNFFGSVMIFLDRPFQIGDWIHFDEVDGIVEEVGIRSTRIRTFANSLIYVPNAKLADATIDNMGLRKFRRYKTEIAITYDTPPEIIDVFVEGIKEIIRQHPTTRKDYFEVSLNSFGESSLNILLYMFFEADDWTKELKGRHEVIYGIIKLAKDIGVRFAFPTQTLHIEEFPEKRMGTPQSITQHDAIIKSKQSLESLKLYFESSDRKQTDITQHPLGGV